MNQALKATYNKVQLETLKYVIIFYQKKYVIIYGIHLFRKRTVPPPVDESVRMMMMNVKHSDLSSLTACRI